MGYYGVLHGSAGYCRVLQGTAGYCRVLQGIAGYLSTRARILTYRYMYQAIIVLHIIKTWVLV